MGKFRDLTEMKFGRLTVVKRVDDYVSPSGNHNVQWLCKCDCEENKYIVVSGGSLTRGLTKSCGCVQKKQSAENGKKNKKYNTYDLSGEYGVGYTTKGEEFYFDLEDYDKIKDYCWYIGNNGYIMSTDSKTKKKILFHRIVTDCPNEFMPDHIHGKETKNDNRKSNLRIVTKQQNSMNSALSINNISGVSGVKWHSRDNIWESCITVNYKRIYLGQYNKFEDAVKARKQAEEKYFGEYSYDNSQSYNTK